MKFLTLIASAMVASVYSAPSKLTLTLRRIRIFHSTIILTITPYSLIYLNIIHILMIFTSVLIIVIIH